MYLRNRKLKSRSFSSNDEVKDRFGQPKVNQRVTRSQRQLNMPIRWSDYTSEFDEENDTASRVSIGVDIEPMNTENQASLALVDKGADSDSFRVIKIVKPPDGNEVESTNEVDTDEGSMCLKKNRSYCCHLCGKTFAFLCRLKTHMPTHTNVRQYQCKLCPKRYKMSSSLFVHKNKHLGLAPQRRQRNRPTKKPVKRVRSLTQKIDIKVDKEMENRIETVNVEMERDFEHFLELNLGDDSLDGVAGQLDSDPLSDENPPFIWVDKDSEAKVASTPSAIECMKPISSDLKNQRILRESNRDNRAAFGALKVIAKPNSLWQKDSNDPHACFTDILRNPKSKRNLFPSPIFNEPESAQFMKLPTKFGHKNIESAIEYREVGDVAFMLKQWLDAKKWYNQSLCHAEKGTPHLAAVYAKRAQCFFILKMYRKCWIDLNLAEKSGLPPQLLPQLERHKQSCRAMMNRNSESDIGIEPMLSFPAHRNFPEMANALEIACNNEFGRHIVAKQSLDVGQIVLIEEAFVSTSSEYYEKCCICLTGDSNMVPCPSCTKAMLCKDCVHSRLHQVECELHCTLNLNEFPWLFKVVRSILNAVTLFSTTDEMMQFVANSLSSSELRAPETIVDRKSKYRAFLQLLNKPIFKPELIPAATQLHTAILGHKMIGSAFNLLKHRRFLSHLIMHHICVIQKFGIKTNDNGNNGCVEITTPIASYFNHSCAPNAAKFLVGNTVIVVVMRPIKQGQQLFVSYCDVLKGCNDRQLALISEFDFRCKCERCVPVFWTSEIQQWIDYGKTNIQILNSDQDPDEEFVKENFVYLASDDQGKRKELTERAMNALREFGHSKWNHKVRWAYVVFSLLLSLRFQKKLVY